jgi:uridylate kinase
VTKLKYKRVLLKLTGELFGNKNGKGVGFEGYENIAHELARFVKSTKVELTIVVGGGNIFRGREKASEVDEATADYMGMLATVINGIGLQEALERLSVPTRMLTAFEIKAVAEPYIRRRALRHLEKGRVVILTAGIGSPHFTTDSGAALRSVELQCDAILKATTVDGVYNKDPNKHSDAKLLHNVSYGVALKKNLKIMDATAFALCQKYKVPIIIFNHNKLNQMDKIVKGSRIGTLVS